MCPARRDPGREPGHNRGPHSPSRVLSFPLLWWSEPMGTAGDWGDSPGLCMVALQDSQDWALGSSCHLAPHLQLFATLGSLS